MSDLTDRTYCDCRDWLANQRCEHVPPFDGLTPEALRSAADVVQLCWIKMFGQTNDRTPRILRAEADRMEAATRANIEREERLDKLDLDLLALMPDRDHRHRLADTLDDLGYRKTDGAA